MLVLMNHIRILSRAVEFLPIRAGSGSIVGRKAMSSSIVAEPSPQQVQVEPEENYENAIKLLNSLQSNAETLALTRQNRDAKRSSSIPQTVGALVTAGITLDLLDTLDVVHVAGTKGKGMTCAFTECILRKAGLKTGFFSSPHLIAVRERIRINGRPLSEETFAKHFFTIYNRVKRLKEPNAPYQMPHYFRFLTIMALHAFIEEEVDAVVLEVGIGGKYDTTNIIRKPVVTGISSLGLEHQSILGNTLEEIATQKAGIMKQGVPLYTVASHTPPILGLLRTLAQDAQCPLYTVQPLDLTNTSVKLGVDDGAVARQNAALAVHLANEFLLQKHPHLFPSLPLSASYNAAELRYSVGENFLPFHIKGLQSTDWPGRFQVFELSDQVTFYLDGAHTIDSLSIALKWFEDKSTKSSLRILVFNITGERSSLTLLKPFAESQQFNMAVFCPFIGFDNKTSLDNWSALESSDRTEPLRKHVEVWESLQNTSKGIVCSSAEAALDVITKHVKHKCAKGDDVSASVLVTGSLHLVGTFLSVLDPRRNE